MQARQRTVSQHALARCWSRFLLAALAAALLGAGSAQAARSVTGQPPGNSASREALVKLNGASATRAGALPSNYVPGEILVKFKAGTSAWARAQALAGQGGRQIRDLDRAGLVHVKLRAGQNVPDAVAAYQRDPGVEYAQPNYIYRALAAPNDTRYGELWGLKNTGQTVSSGTYSANNPGVAGMDMDAELAWDHVTDCRAVVVAVVDSGVNYTHTDLAANMWDGSAAGFPNHGYDFVDDDPDPMDTNGHGTHVAGIIGAVGNNGNGTAGVCWTARIMAVRVAGTFGTAATSAIVQGVNFAVSQGARVINMSLGSEAPFDRAFSDAIDNARNEGVVVVVAAGNGGADGVGDNNDGAGDDGDLSTAFYPCNFTHDNLVCVAALDQAYALADFSNWGSASVDVGAPGTNIVSEWPGTETVWSDDFSAGVGNWSFSPTGRNWVASQQDYGVLVHVMSDPSTFDLPYAPSVNDKAYRIFDFGAADVASISFHADFSVRDPGDFVRVLYDPSGGVPASVIAEVTNAWTGFALVPLAYEVPVSCLVATCSLGFNLQSDADGIVDFGLELAFVTVKTLSFDTTSYKTIDGTSMASPHVAGLAAMVMAYNPDYTYLDVISSIKNGGTPVAALAGRTTTGKAVNAMGSLAYINPPTGVTAVVR